MDFFTATIGWLVDVVARVLMLIIGKVLMSPILVIAAVRKRHIRKGLRIRDLSVIPSFSGAVPNLVFTCTLDSKTLAEVSLRRALLPIYAGSALVDLLSGELTQQDPQQPMPVTADPLKLRGRGESRLTFISSPNSAFWWSGAGVQIQGGSITVESMWGPVQVDLGGSFPSVIRDAEDQVTGFLRGLKAKLEAV